MVCSVTTVTASTPSMRAWDDLTPADQERHAWVSPMH